MNNRIYYLLFIIVFVAAFLRFYQIGTNPPSLTWDEVAWGYNAYSLGIDGKDEFGRFLPYDYLESFGDFKPPMYAYLSIIPVMLFGLTEFATRFASAFFGVLTVLLTYFLVKEIFGRTKQNHTQNHSETIALLSAGILAISPWHIMLSRAAFEANVATFFLILGVFLFLRGIHKTPWLLTISAISFVASMYTFNTSRVVAPLLVIMLMVGCWKKLVEYKKQVIFAAITGLVVLLPIVPFLLSPQASLRFREVNIFSDPQIVEIANQEIANDGNAWWSKILHNRRLLYGVSFLQHYFDNLSPRFLFIQGDGNPKFSTQDVGQLYMVSLPFLVLGFFFLFRRREGHWWVIPIWLMLGIIPAATARETPHALRIETTLPTFQILVAYGIFQMMVWIRNSYTKRIFTTAGVVIGFLYLSCVTYFVHGYFGHYAWQYAGEWQYGYKDAIIYARSVEDDYNRIYLTNELGRAYMYTLFYKQYDPEIFRKEAVVKRDPFGFVKIDSFGKYIFEKDALDEKTEHMLRIDRPWNVPSNAKIEKKFYLPNGSEVLIAYTLD